VVPADDGTVLFGIETLLPNTGTLPGEEAVVPTSGGKLAGNGATFPAGGAKLLLGVDRLVPLLGIETLVPNTATFAGDAAGVTLLEGNAPFVTTDGTLLEVGEEFTVPLGMETLLPNTATLPAGDAALVSTGDMVTGDETLPEGGVALLPVDAGKFELAAEDRKPVDDEDMEPVDEMLPAGDGASLPARSVMPSPLKSAATTFPLSAFIRARSIANGRLVRATGVVRATDCAWPRALIVDTVNSRRIRTRLIGIKGLRYVGVFRWPCSIRAPMNCWSGLFRPVLLRGREGLHYASIGTSGSRR
jgi:hypothetical protein